MRLHNLFAILALAVAVFFATGAQASPTIDASGITRTSQHLGATISAPVTTTSTNDAVVVSVQNVLGASNATVVSITGCGLTFSRLIAVTVLGSPNAANINMEIWSAGSAAAQSACALTVTLSGSTQDVIDVVTFGVHGLNDINSPLDTNAGAKSCTSSASTTPTAPTLTTSQANDLLLAFGFTVDGTTPKAWTPATWTALYGFRDTLGASFNTDVGASWTAVSATQSGVSADLTTPAGNTFPAVECALAFRADAASAPASNGGTMSLMGVGR